MPSAEYTEAQREYREVYLRSEHWQEVRKAALERAGHRCQICNKPDRLDVHHRTYERKGCEEPGDVIALCRGCHEIFHGNSKVHRARSRSPKKSGRVNWSTMSKEQQTELTEKVVALLTEHPAGLTSGDIAVRLNTRTQVAGSCLVALSRKGQARKKSKKAKRWILKGSVQSIDNWIEHFQDRPFRSMRTVNPERRAA